MTPVILKPRLSEKAYALSQSGVYVFDVPEGSNSQQVAKAVNLQFSVGVERVRLTAGAAKSRKLYRKRGNSKDVTKSAFRKAYVTLKEGDSLPFFAAEEKTEKKSKKESK
jgi:large subunit ribosomal protein L23